MSTQPTGFVIGPDPLDQLEWSRQGHDNEVGADLIENWAELFHVPDRDPDG